MDTCYVLVVKICGDEFLCTSSRGHEFNVNLDSTVQYSTVRLYMDSCNCWYPRWPVWDWITYSYICHFQENWSMSIEQGRSISEFRSSRLQMGYWLLRLYYWRVSNILKHYIWNKFNTQVVSIYFFNKIAFSVFFSKIS